MKAYYGRSVDMRDPFEKERYWETYREWYEKTYKGYAAGTQPRPLLNRENFSPERFGAPGPRRENSPYVRGRRDDYPTGLGHRNRNIGGGYSEKLPGRGESHSMKDIVKLKEKDIENPPGEGKGNKHKRHRKRRRGEECEVFPSTDLLEGSRKPRDLAPGGEDSKPDPLFVLPSRDDATPVRDEPMEADSVAFKPISDKERKEKPKAKPEKAKRKVESTAVVKKEAQAKLPKAPPEKAEIEHEKSPRTETQVKKVKEEVPKAESGKSLSSQKEEKPRKVHPRVSKEHPDVKSVKEEKAKKEHPKEVKQEKPSSKEEKAKKPVDKNKPVEAKPEKRKRKAEEKSEKDHEATSLKVGKSEGAEPKALPKGKSEPEGDQAERSPEKEKEKTVSPVPPAKKIKLNRETGKKIVGTESLPTTKESPTEKPEPSSSNKGKPEKAKGKPRRKIPAVDGPGSTLVDYTRYLLLVLCWTPAGQDGGWQIRGVGAGQTGS